MTNTAFRDFISSRPELKYVGNAGIGRIGDFPVLINLMNNVPTVHICLNPDDAKAIKKDFTKAFKRIAPAMFGPEKILMSLNGNKHTMQDKYQELVDTIIPFFYDHNVQPVSTCPYCGAGSCNVTAMTPKGYTYAHESCVNDSVSKELEKVEHNETSGSYALGLVGAIIGGIVGSIPAVLLMYFANMVSAWTFALIPIAAIFGYKLFKGKTTKASVVIIILVSIICGLFSNLCDVAIYLMHDYGLPFSTAVAYLADIDVLSAFTGRFLQSLLFIALGIFFAWGFISKTNKSVQKDAMAASETIMHI